MDSKKFFNKKDQKAKIKQEKKEQALKEAKESSSSGSGSGSDSEESEAKPEIAIEVEQVKPTPEKVDGNKTDQYFSTIAFKDLNLSE